MLQAFKGYLVMDKQRHYLHRSLKLMLGGSTAMTKYLLNGHERVQKHTRLVFYEHLQYNTNLEQPQSLLPSPN